MNTEKENKRSDALADVRAMVDEVRYPVPPDVDAMLSLEASVIERLDAVD